jgi:hypothetical protein
LPVALPVPVEVKRAGNAPEVGQKGFQKEYNSIEIGLSEIDGLFGKNKEYNYIDNSRVCSFWITSGIEDNRG